jgi:BirA family biotin operon repressor/biotin-[acetyl-CoA-carboxylase] ligase
MSESVDLPHVYELVQRDVIDSVVAEAGRLAQAGADEGTLVWAQEQSAARDRFGQPQPSPRGNLYICLILRPESALAVAQQLVLVSTISLGLTIAEAAPPMTDLRYRWPDAVLLNNAETGVITFVPGPENAGNLEWLLLGVTANVNHVPVALDVYSTSLQAEGMERVSAAEVLQGFSRHFLSGINRWADAGFAQTRKAFMHRMEGLGKVQEIRLKNETIIGKLVELDEQGALILEREDGARRVITVIDYLGLS